MTRSDSTGVERIFELPTAVRLLPSAICILACSPPVLVGAGDIADCNSRGSGITARLLDDIGGTVFTLGDNAYEAGTTEEFRRCYAPTWGRHKQRTRPAPGNHDYDTPGAMGYFAYFGTAAGDPTTGYYSYNVGRWHVVVINSQLCWITECNGNSPQEEWLRRDLALHPTLCTLAYMHLPRFSSGTYHGPAYEMEPIWKILFDAGVELVLSGHEHNYERFAPQDPAGALDPVNGIRQFVVGTGGRHLYPIGEAMPNSEVRYDGGWGVLKLRLKAASYEWEFVGQPDSGFSDRGSGICH